MTGTPNARQNHFRVRIDGGLVNATPTWGAAEDTTFWPGFGPFRLRIAIDNTGAANASNLELTCSKNGGAYQGVFTTSTVCTSIDLSASGSTTSAISTASFFLTAGAGVAQAGTFNESMASGGRGSITAGDYSEFEASCQFMPADLAAGDVVTFEITGTSTGAFTNYNVIPTFTVPAADTAPSSPTTYFFSNTASDLTAAGQTGTATSKAMVTSGATSGTFAPTLTATAGGLADSSADVSFFAPSGIPGAGGSSNAGKYSTISMDITTGNTNIRYYARLVRVNSTGVVQAWGGASAPTSSGATGIYTVQCSWNGLGTWASGDRLRVDVRLWNGLINTAGQTATLTYDANSFAQFLTAAPTVYVLKPPMRVYLRR